MASRLVARSPSCFLQVSSASIIGRANMNEDSKTMDKIRKQELRRTLLPGDPGVRPFSDIPGPPSLPILGTLGKYYRGEYDIQKPYETYSLFLKEHGPLVKENLFYGTTLLHIFNTEDMLEVIRDGNAAYPIRNSHSAIKKYRLKRKHLYGHIGVACSNGEEWKSYRKEFSADLGKMKRINPRTFVGQYSVAFEAIADDLLEYLKANLDHNEEISLLPAFYYYTLECVGALVLGTRMGCFDQDRREDVSRFIQAVHETHYAIHVTELKPRILARKEYKTLELAQDYITYFVLKHIDYINGQIEKGSIRNMDPFAETLENVEDMIDEDKSDPIRLSESLIYQKLKSGMHRRMLLPMIADLFQGGIHSTAHSLAFALYHLALNPDKQEILKRELVRLYPEKSERIVCKMPGLLYLGNVIKETLRLNPPTIGTGRVTNTDMVLSGYFVPKGTQVILHLEIASKLEDNTPEPLRFIPERDYISASKPFIEGSKRYCIGKGIALDELKIAIAKILRYFEVSYNYKKVGVKNFLINEPDAPIKLRLKELSDVPTQVDKTEEN